MMALAGVLVGGAVAQAFTMGEVAATTGVQGTLASSGTSNVAGTIGSVKNALGAAAATKQKQLDGAATQMAWGGKAGGASHWATPGTGGGSGWAVASAGWSANGGGGAGGWAGGGGKTGAGWASGPWGGH